MHVSSLKTTADTGPTGMGINSFAFDDPTSPSLSPDPDDDSEESNSLPLPLTKEMAQSVLPHSQGFTELTSRARL